MSTDLMEQPVFSLVPKTLGEAMELAKLIATSDLAPKDYRDKPGNVLIAVQMGQEVGLSPMAAIQNIAVINGKPGIYGDAGKGILLSKGFMIDEDDIDVIKKNGRGRCKITRPGNPDPCERTFSIENAKTAGLWGKSGPWTQYPERQMAWRAFWFAARDIAADVLKGLKGFEEIIDYQPPEREINPVGGATSAPSPQPTEIVYLPNEDFAAIKTKYKSTIAAGSKTVEDLIAWIEAKGKSMTEAQKMEVSTWAKKPEVIEGESKVIDDPFVDDMNKAEQGERQ
jgi:hypothetical protein